MSRPCIAIAWRWVFTPPNVFLAKDDESYDLALVVSRCCGPLDGKEGPLCAEPNTVVYHARLPQKEQAAKLSDVSGELGLVYPASGAYLKRRASAAERLISDAVIWALADQDLQVPENKHDALLLVLLQGPLLPKLRGRILYRSLSSRVRLFSLTYDPEWLQSLEAAPRMIATLDGKEISAVYPPAGIDRPTRSWIARQTDGKGSDHFYHVEAVIDASYCCEHATWEKDLQAEASEVIRSCRAADPQAKATTPPLPLPLLKATEKAVFRQNAEAHFSRIMHMLTPTASRESISKTPEGALVANFLDPEGSAAQSNQLTLLAATDQEKLNVDWGNKNGVYQRLISDYALEKLPLIV